MVPLTFGGSMNFFPKSGLYWYALERCKPLAPSPSGGPKDDLHSFPKVDCTDLGAYIWSFGPTT